MLILVVMPLLARQQEKMKNELTGHEVVFERDPSEELIAKADVIVGNLKAARLSGAASLRLMQLNSAGSNEYLPLLRERRDFELTCATGAYGQALGEHLLAMMLTLIKKLPLYRDAQQSGTWRDRGPVRAISELKVLSVGMGDAGGYFARLAASLGCEVIGVRRTAGKACPEGVRSVYTVDKLDELLGWADVVALSMPETQDTIRMMDARRLGLMKDGSYLLNVGRGSAIDQEALLGAIRSGHLAGAGLDVTTPEPLPADSPLWREENILITPHISGQFHLEQTRDRIVGMAIENIRRFEKGEKLISRVDPERGY